jgi:predicted ATP-dependent serine protease
MRNLEQFQCPECGFQKTSSFGRTCDDCGYRGDWVQPGETMTYEETKRLEMYDNPAHQGILMLFAINSHTRIFGITRQQFAN